MITKTATIQNSKECCGLMRLMERREQTKTLQHLNMIYRFLNDENIEEHAYASLQTYIHGKWKKGRLKFSKAISQHLSTHNLSFENDAQVRHST